MSNGDQNGSVIVGDHWCQMVIEIGFVTIKHAAIETFNRLKLPTIQSTWHLIIFVIFNS